MKKHERTQIKIAVKKYYKIGYSLLLLGISMFILFALLPAGPVREIFKSNMLIFSIILTSVCLLPLMLSLIFILMGSTKINQINDFERKLRVQQNKFHMKLFWEAVRSSNFDEAKRLYNMDGFILGSERTLCNGILMGIATQVPIDETWSQKVDERMNGYFL
jgi:hypothetical protein